MIENRSLQEVANAACRDLPDGWWIEIYLELGSGFMTLFDSAGNEVEVPGYDQNLLSEQVYDAIEIANGRPTA